MEELTYDYDLIEAEFRYRDSFGVKNKIKKSIFDEQSDLENTLKAYEIINAQQSRKLKIQNLLKSKISIFDHQIMAAQSVKNDLHGRVLLADEVGLGKTIEAGILLKEYFVTGMIRNALILTPPSLRTQWHDELNSKFDLDFIKNDDETRFKGFDQHTMLISSLSKAVIPKNARFLKNIEWDVVIVDEAHRLKNAATQAHKFVKELDKKFIFLLTATPVQNSLKELYNLVEIVRPGLLGSWKEFANTYTYDKKAQIIPHKRNELQDELKKVMIRTTRNEIKDQITLSDRIPKTHLLEPTADEIELYEQSTEFVRQLWVNEKSGSNFILPLMTLQRQISSSTAALREAIHKRYKKYPHYETELDNILKLADVIKIDSKMNKLDEIIKENPQDKYLIFTEFRDTQDYISESLDERGIESIKFHGSMSTGERDIAVGKFKNDIQIMVSTEAGGEGQNFQFCNKVINYDLPWNPMRIEQRVGRVHRIGQNEDVSIHNMALIGSIEEYVLKLIFNKINLFKMTIGDLDLLFEDDNTLDRLPSDIFESYMSATTKIDRENKFSVMGDKLNRKKNVHDTIMEFDSKVLAGFDLSAMK